MGHLVNCLLYFLIKFIHSYYSTIEHVTLTVPSDMHTQLHRYNSSFYHSQMILFLSHLLQMNCNVW